ncbi:3'(2'),5'-bisphosphate nucleotidase CysQ [Methylobacillus gramineus]|uniref:3'(2'),5'-bisphosphate nucleotidase CysQ n=1 Tax=Methylobacillus gramineus TaxID=755169 RepID=UPI001D00013F|nr:3'(2'),5'-bisphosphate nucleotidase CysQ [Methylobacillus gramineus]MCB5184295.1 3'(2'),5'-bisphosphate nucleotidase CysQ [Methylobacillus gramineus]
MNNIELSALIALSRKAGAAIMEIYRSDFSVQHKGDQSPLTEADLAAHRIIAMGLAALAPAIPLISEEAELAPFAARQSWKRYWLVDPLDGTREFVKRNDEFTVNIALIEQGVATMGVVYAPALDICYFADSEGAWKQEGDAPASPIQARPMSLEQITLAVSRSHIGSKTQNLINNVSHRHGTPEIIAMGSSLKICLIAEGKADLYLRLGLTSEWDTAAGQCVLEQAGGYLVDRHGLRLQYNLKDTILNPEFFACGSTLHDWNQYLD